MFGFYINVRINGYNPNNVFQFCGNNKQQIQVKSEALPVLELCQKKYGHGFWGQIIPDLRKYLECSGNITESDIKGVLGHGGLSFVFDIGEQEVLKASLENPLEFRAHNPSFDIPFLSPVEKFGKTYFVREPKADTKNISVADALNVIKRIQSAGLETSKDFHKYKTCQIGKYNGKVYLLDTRCAVPRPNAFSRFIYDFKSFNLRVLKTESFSPEAIAKRDERFDRNVKLFGPRYLHIDEYPRPNLSFKRGLKIMKSVMKRNKNYGLPSIDSYTIIRCILRLINR